MYISRLIADIGEGMIEELWITDPGLYQDAQVKVSLINKSERRLISEWLKEPFEQAEVGRLRYERSPADSVIQLNGESIEATADLSELLSRLLDTLYPYIEM